MIRCPVLHEPNRLSARLLYYHTALNCRSLNRINICTERTKTMRRSVCRILKNLKTYSFIFRKRLETTEMRARSVGTVRMVKLSKWIRLAPKKFENTSGPPVQQYYYYTQRTNIRLIVILFADDLFNSRKQIWIYIVKKIDYVYTVPILIRLVQAAVLNHPAAAAAGFHPPTEMPYSPTYYNNRQDIPV